MTAYLPSLETFRRLRDEFAVASCAERYPRLIAERDRLRAEAAPMWKLYRANKSIAASNTNDYDAKRIKLQTWEALGHLYEVLQPIEAEISAIEADYPKRVKALGTRVDVETGEIIEAGKLEMEMG